MGVWRYVYQVKDNRPARAVLSAPYPLPIVITRPHVHAPNTTAAPIPLPLLSTYTIPNNPIRQHPPVQYAKTEGSHTPQRERRNRLRSLRRKGKKAQGGEETEWDLMSGIVEEKGGSIWGDIRPFALELSTTTGVGMEGEGGPSVTGLSSSLNRTAVEALVGGMNEDEGSDASDSDERSANVVAVDCDMEGDDESDPTHKPWDRSTHNHVPRFHSLFSAHSKSARSSNAGGYVSEATSTKTVIRIPRSRHARQSDTRPTAEGSRERDRGPTRDKVKGKARARSPSVSSRLSQTAHSRLQEGGPTMPQQCDATNDSTPSLIQSKPSRPSPLYQLPIRSSAEFGDEEPLPTGIPMSIDTMYSLLPTGMAMSIDPKGTQLNTGIPMSVDPRSSDIRYALSGQPSGWPHPLDPREIFQAETRSRTNMPPPAVPARQVHSHSHLPLVSPVHPLTRNLRLPTAPPARPGSGIIPIHKACHNAWLASKVEYTKRVKAAKAIEERHHQLQEALGMVSEEDKAVIDPAEAAIGLALMGKEEDGGPQRDFGLNIAGPSGKVYTQPVSTIGIVPPGSTEMIWITPQQYLALQQDRQGASTSIQAVSTPERNATVRAQRTMESVDLTPTSHILTTPPTESGSPRAHIATSSPQQSIRAITSIGHVALAENDEPEYLGTKPARKRLRADSPVTVSRPVFAIPVIPNEQTTSIALSVQNVQGGLPLLRIDQSPTSGVQAATARAANLTIPPQSNQTQNPPHTSSPYISAAPTQSRPSHLLPSAQIPSQPRVRLGRPLPHLPPDLDFDLAPRTPRGHLLTEDIWDLMLTDAMAAESPLAMRLERDRRARHTEWVRQQRELTYDRLEKEERERQAKKQGGRMGTVDMEGGGRGGSVRMKIDREESGFMKDTSRRISNGRKRQETVVMEDVSAKSSGKGRKRAVDDE